MEKKLIITLREDYTKRKIPFKIRLATNAFVFSDLDTLIWDDDNEYLMCIRRNPHSYDNVYGKEMEAQIFPYEFIEFFCVDLTPDNIESFLTPQINSGKITKEECLNIVKKYCVTPEQYTAYSVQPKEDSYSHNPKVYHEAKEVNKNLKQITP